MNDPVQTMPHLETLIKGSYNIREWLHYYKNIWVRNLTARLIDVETDKVLKQQDPEQLVPSHDGREMVVKERLEYRKMLVQDAVDLIAGIELLIAKSDDELKSACSKEALAVAEDMIPKTSNVGDACTNEAGVPGTLQPDGKGGLTCVVEPAPAAMPKEGEEPSAEAKV
jgi:hypothetical protein